LRNGEGGFPLLAQEFASATRGASGARQLSA
jgi:hypothetical protein